MSKSNRHRLVIEIKAPCLTRWELRAVEELYRGRPGRYYAAIEAIAKQLFRHRAGYLKFPNAWDKGMEYHLKHKLSIMDSFRRSYEAIKDDRAGYVVRKINARKSQER